MSYNTQNLPSTPPEQPLEQLPEPTARRRTFFWPAFVVSFLLLAFASCGGAAALVGFDDLSFADFQSTGPVWTPPAASTTQVGVAESGDADSSPTSVPSSRFQPGGRAENATSSRVNIRRAPGYLNKPDGDVLAQIQPGETVEILGWSRSVDNLIWWPVRYQPANGTAVDGWIAESTESGVQILVPLP